MLRVRNDLQQGDLDAGILRPFYCASIACCGGKVVPKLGVRILSNNAVVQGGSTLHNCLRRMDPTSLNVVSDPREPTDTDDFVSLGQRGGLLRVMRPHTFAAGRRNEWRRRWIRGSTLSAKPIAAHHGAQCP